MKESLSCTPLRGVVTIANGTSDTLVPFLRQDVRFGDKKADAQHEQVAHETCAPADLQLTSATQCN